MPNDGGHLLLSQEEKDELLSKEPKAEKFIKPFSMGDEFINSIPRYCLWITSDTLDEAQSLPEVNKRINLVRKTRLKSTREATNKLASIPHLFGEIRQPSKGHYLALPRVSSEKGLIFL